MTDPAAQVPPVATSEAPPAAPRPTETLVIVDGTNYAFRAFHALPPMTSSKGFPTGALYGFSQMMLNLQRQERPTYLLVAFDAKGPSLRKQRFEAYKATRKETPPELLQQMPFFRHVTEALGIAWLEQSGYEADDIIASMVKKLRSPNLAIRIVSSDKDLAQLVDDQVVMLDTLRNIVFDAKQVEEKWGVPPSRIRDLLALQGDTADNIPGIRGVGPKKARDLIHDLGSIEAVLAHPEEIKNPKLREAVMAGLDDARLSLELVTLLDDMPLPTTLEELRPKGMQLEACRSLFQELEFNRLLKELKVPAKQDTEQGAVTSQSPLIRVKEEAELAPLFLALEAGAPLAVYPTGEEGGLGIFGLGLATGPDQAFYLPLPAGQPVPPRMKAFLEAEAVPKWTHAAKPLIHRLRRRGVALAGLASDTELAAWLLDPARSEPRLEDVVQRHLQQGLSVGTDAPGAREAQLLVALVPVLEAELEKQGLTSLYKTLELPLLGLLARLEAAGIALDVAVLTTLGKELETRMKEAETRLYTLAGGEFNPNSPKQLQTILFEKLGLPVLKKTKTGPSTDQEVLEELAEKHALPAEILAYRSLAKLKNTYVDTLPGQAAAGGGRVSTTFNQTVAATGRLSSSDPNLQNIPIRGEEGKRIRAAFVAPVGHVLLSADYSQIELRLLAHLSGDEALQEAFRSGLDIHTATAAEMFNVTPGLVTSAMRRSAKAINFGILYGMGPTRLARDLKIGKKEAEQYIERYFARYPRVRGFLDGCLEQARARGYVTTLLQRRRYLPEINSATFAVRQSAERMATNTPIQGSAADIIKLAMLQTDAALKEAGLSARMLLQVHDELIFEVEEGAVEATVSLVKARMEQAVPLSVPLVVEVGKGRSWAEAH